jgi:hypothetical protein
MVGEVGEAGCLRSQNRVKWPGPSLRTAMISQHLDFGNDFEHASARR